MDEARRIITCPRCYRRGRRDDLHTCGPVEIAESVEITKAEPVSVMVLFEASFPGACRHNHCVFFADAGDGYKAFPLAHVIGKMSKWIGTSDKVLGDAMRERAQAIVDKARGAA